MDKVKIYVDKSNKKIYVQVIEDDNLVYSGFISFDDFKPDYNFYSNYYLTDNSVYKLVDNNKLPVYIEACYDIVSLVKEFNYKKNLSADFVVSYDFIIFKDLKIPVAFYESNGVLFFNDELSVGDKKYKVYLKLDINSFKFVFYISEIVDGKEVFVDFDFNFANYVFSRSSLLNIFYFEDSEFDNSIVKQVKDLKSFISDNFKKINIDFTPIENSLNKISSDIKNGFNEIFSKIDILGVFDISKMIDDKLTQIFNLHSLNGSNGSKFKDGSIVKIKGYDGDWKVEGSYPLLNSDGVTIIVYKVVQDGRVLLAPSPFVGV